MTSLADLLHQPVRWRIVQALIGNPMTTAQLAERLPDIPTTTLYRHVAVLVKAEVLRVVDERRVRGATERTYELDAGAADAGDVATDPDRLRALFTVYLAGLARDFDRYLDRGDVDLVRDGVGFRQGALWLTDDELAQVQQGMNALLAPYLSAGSEPGRSRRILSTVLMPGE